MDHMKDLYAPWRSSYARAKDDQTRQETTQSNECVFCSFLKEKNDAQHFILKRYTHCFAILNKYPYNAGHLMVIPLAHAKNLHDLSSEARAEIMEITSLSVNIVQTELKADGINLGLNLGSAAGAGIPSHLHMHVLPRWHGDTNFLPALADIKIVSFNLKEIYDLLKPAFDNQ